MPSQFPASFPRARLRRNRRAPWVRSLVAESRLGPQDLIAPLFVIEGTGAAEDIAQMPGVQRLTIDGAVRAAREAVALGIPAIAVFPRIADQLKDDNGKEALNPGNLVCRTVAAIKQAVPGIGVICDVALDPYTTHGHDGLLRNGEIANDATVDTLIQQAVVQARAGCDVVAPSDMMDGRIGAVRDALDGAGFAHVQILSYAAKYASAFYGPFRDAVGTGTRLVGDKKTYQMDSANSDEALREVALDIAEGADMVMVKPGMPYLDIVRRVKDTFGMPTFVYQVSGEYSMIVAAAERGFLDREKAMLEALLAFKRAGADAIVSYFAFEAARLLQRR